MIDKKHGLSTALKAINFCTSIVFKQRKTYKTILASHVVVASLFTWMSPASAGELVVFGGSLSDMGNTQSLLPYTISNIYEGRASNGEVPVGVLAGYLNKELSASLHLTLGSPQGNNFAFASARTRDRSQDPTLSNPLIALTDIPKQVDAYLASNNQIASSDSTYILSLGINDIRDARETTTYPALSCEWNSRFYKRLSYWMKHYPEYDYSWVNPEYKRVHAIMEGAILNSEIVLKRLVASGARKIMLIEVPSLSLFPESRESVSGLDCNPKLIAKKGDFLAKLFNRKLKRTVKQLEAQYQFKIVNFDLNAPVKNLSQNGKAYGFTNTTDACFDPSIVPIIEFKPTKNCDITLVNEFLSFDGIHLTANAYERIGREMFARVPSSSE